MILQYFLLLEEARRSELSRREGIERQVILNDATQLGLPRRVKQQVAIESPRNKRSPRHARQGDISPRLLLPLRQASKPMYVHAPRVSVSQTGLPQEYKDLCRSLEQRVKHSHQAVVPPCEKSTLQFFDVNNEEEFSDPNEEDDMYDDTDSGDYVAVCPPSEHLIQVCEHLVQPASQPQGGTTNKKQAQGATARSKRRIRQPKTRTVTRDSLPLIVLPALTPSYTEQPPTKSDDDGVKVDDERVFRQYLKRLEKKLNQTLAQGEATTRSAVAGVWFAENSSDGMSDHADVLTPRNGIAPHRRSTNANMAQHRPSMR